ncbi:hypothetical protein CYY_004828 [Polysphondylium violaceum]|uniref:Fluoroacetyl-CoA-specific thioesterase-like domain-containing protein n=1 Tax=Polysphondylium violaceum TaxID=133409 RepID=A0A8J4PU04_9MYCE|nr:hypothetical protein CYY_004828 [Polysphondylium violaceum]
MMMQVGDTTEIEWTVQEKHLASSVGSGDVQVFSTPCLLALMEEACVKSIQGKLAFGSTTVGTSAQISHLAATPLNMKVRALARITQITQKKISFSIEAFDEKERIGECTHERFIVDRERFMSKCNSKSSSSPTSSTSASNGPQQ